MNATSELPVANDASEWRKAAGILFADKKREGFAPVALHLYRAADGSIVYARVRMCGPVNGRGKPEKFIRPFWYDGERWIHGEPAQDGGKVLYGLREALAAPDARVIVCEGEQKADALTRIGAGRFVGVTSGSATSAGGADWMPLAGRHVLLWPDNDGPGMRYTADVSARLVKLACTVERLDVEKLALPAHGDVMDWCDAFEAAHGRSPLADDVLVLPLAGEPSSGEPDAGEAASDAQPRAVGPGFPAMDERPCWRMYETAPECGGKVALPGVFWHGVKPGRGDAPPALVDQWVCTPLRVAAVTRNREDAEYGRLLEIRSPAGRWKKWAMPMSMLAGDGNEARAVLLAEGLMFDLRDRGAVLRYIASVEPCVTMRAASVTGWHDGAFVLPDVVIGADDIWFQSSGRVAPYASAGTFEGWCELAALAENNPLMMFGISAALAGPLLGPLNIEGCGVHLFGDSSGGKTTGLLAAISVWGGPAFRRTWRSTSNGLEGAGAMHSDTLLGLDEIGEIDPRNLYESAYALINGMGKTRANRHGEARQVARWRVFVLSTGELTLAARMGAGGIEARAGQEIRILDVPVTGSFGLFDTLHGRSSGGVLADEVRDLAARHYGHAGPRFVDALVHDLRDGLRLSDLLQPLAGRFGATGGQELRAARTFAVAALAGELAVRWGVAPWREGEPMQAAIHAFELWRGRRQTNGQCAEHVKILGAVGDFIDRYGQARFEPIEGGADIVRDRAGYWKRNTDRTLYLFTPGGLREATKGHDLARVTAALEEAGALAAADTGKRSKTTRTPDGGTARLYYVDPARLAGSE